MTEADELKPLEIRHGLKSLATYIGKSERQVQYLVNRGELPAKQIGGRWTWSPEKVRQVVMGDGI